MSHAAHTVNPQQPPYRDRKRYAWILSLLVPSLVGFGPLLMVTTGDVQGVVVSGCVFLRFCTPAGLAAG
jgi:hypothetical protein